MDQGGPEVRSGSPPDLADEGRHRPPSPPVPGWCEWWSFDACSPDGSTGLFVRLALHPASRRCAYWAGLVWLGSSFVLVRLVELEIA